MTGTTGMGDESQEQTAPLWRDLLEYLEEGRVIAVVDTATLPVRHDGVEQPFESLVTRQAAQRLGIRLPEGNRLPRLDDLVSAFLLKPRARKEELYMRVNQVMRDLALEPPQALLDLAAVDAISLFVNLSFDNLLVRALDQVRHGGQARTQSVVFAPNACDDLPEPRERLSQPLVYHLLGRQSTAPDWVICDEDRLEFMHALQDDTRRPQLLFDALRDCHLLLLGCRLPDWLARFFLRTAKSERLSSSRDTVEYLVDPDAVNDARLKSFLADFSPATTLVGLEPAPFARELCTQWQTRHPPAAASADAALGSTPGAASLQRPAPGATASSSGAVFISYSSADRPAAQALADALDGAGIDVWFDREDLHAGDDWDRNIRRGLETSCLFVPVISRTTVDEGHRRDYFWREWMAADELARGMAPDEPFLLPVVIDDTRPYGSVLPDRFRQKQWTPLPGGRATPQFVQSVRDLYRQFGARARRA